MKKIIIISFLLLTALSANAQKNYLKIGGGYNFSLGSDLIITDIDEFYTYTPNYNTNRYETAYKIKEKGIYGSFGKGMNFNITCGTNISDNISMEFCLNYLHGGLFEGKRVLSETYSDMGVFIMQTEEKKLSGKMLSITPSILFRAFTERKWKGYIRMGLIIGKGWYNSESHYKLDLPFNYQDTLIDMKYVYNGNLSIGASGTFGLITSLNEKFSFFTELTLVCLNSHLINAELIEYKINGVDKKSEASENDKATDYSNEIEYTSANEKTQAIKRVSPSIPFSSFGINIGIQYNFNN